MPEPEAVDVGAGPWDLASPSEIRRRGEARARRRRAGAGMAALALVALVATPLVMGRGDSRPSDVTARGSAGNVPASRDDHSWTQSVPASFTLDSGLGSASEPATVSRGDENTLSGVLICGTPTWTGAQGPAASDMLVAAGPRERRVLLVYPDRGVARDAARAVRRAAESCTPTPTQSARVIAFTTGMGDLGVSWAHLFSRGAGLGPTEGTGSLLVAQVGNSVLLDQWSSEGASVAQAGGHAPAHVAQVLREMCVFDRTRARRPGDDALSSCTSACGFG